MGFSYLKSFAGIMKNAFQIHADCYAAFQLAAPKWIAMGVRRFDGVNWPGRIPILSGECPPGIDC